MVFSADRSKLSNSPKDSRGRSFPAMWTDLSHFLKHIVPESSVALSDSLVKRRGNVIFPQRKLTKENQFENNFWENIVVNKIELSEMLKTVENF